MSKYTTEVRYICEEYNKLQHSADGTSVDDIITNAIPLIFDNSFAMFDENYRTVICKKILKHYYTREIGFETVGLWKLKLNTAMAEIMPYYNQLYKSELLEFNPLYDTDITTNYNKKNNGEENKTENNKDVTSNESTMSKNNSKNYQSDTTTDSTSTVSSTNDHTESGTNESTTSNDTTRNLTTTGNTSGDDWKLYSDTPQGAVSGIENETYLTNATKNTNTGEKEEHETGTVGETGSGSVNTSGTAKDVVSETGSGKVTGGRTDTESETSSGSSTLDSTKTGEKTGNSKINSTEDYLESVSGKNGGKSYSELLNEYRSTFLNIDMMVIEELGKMHLFFELW